MCSICSSSGKELSGGIESVPTFNASAKSNMFSREAMPIFRSGSLLYYDKMSLEAASKLPFLVHGTADP